MYRLTQLMLAALVGAGLAIAIAAPDAFAVDDQEEVTPTPAAETAVAPATDAIAPAPELLEVAPLAFAAGDADPTGDPETKEADTGDDKAGGPTNAELVDKIDAVESAIDDVKDGTGSKYTTWGALVMAVLALGIALVQRIRAGSG